MTEGEVLRNRVGVLVGATYSEGTTGGSVGIEYEWTLNELWGIGVALEFTPVLSERVVTLPGLFLHPVGDLVLSAAPGAQFEDRVGKFLVRFGAGWDFELTEQILLTPEVAVDLIEGGDEAFVYGVVLSHVF